MIGAVIDDGEEIIKIGNKDVIVYQTEDGSWGACTKWGEAIAEAPTREELLFERLGL